MPTLIPPPNPVDDTPRAVELQPLKVRAGRHGELDHSELVHLLDSLDDDRSRSRFRESVYLSIIVYLALAWFVFYGPKVLFHQGRVVSPSDVLKQRDKEITFLEVPKDLPKPPPKDAKVISDHNTRQQTARPTLDKKTLEQLQKMRRAGEPTTPAPLPAAPQPQPAQPQPAAQLQPQTKPPVQTANNNIPDAPRPQVKPDFATAPNAGALVQGAANAAARNHGEGGANALIAHPGAPGVEILSDTMGVDFGPYIQRIIRIVKAAWYPLIPEECAPPLSKEGETLIRFTILPDGQIAPHSMSLDSSTHDNAINRAAWGSLQTANLPPLPSTFKGESLQLRFDFQITHYGSDAR